MQEWRCCSTQCDIVTGAQQTDCCLRAICGYLCVYKRTSGGWYAHSHMHAGTQPHTHNHNTIWTSCDGSNIIYITAFEILREVFLQAGSGSPFCWDEETFDADMDNMNRSIGKVRGFDYRHRWYLRNVFVLQDSSVRAAATLWLVLQG